MRGKLLAVAGLAAALVTALAGCDIGSQAKAPTLSGPITVSLADTTGAAAGTPGTVSQSLGDAKFTPTYGAHFVTYVGGKEVPYHDPVTPVQLRKGSCTGPVIGALSDNAPIPSGSETVQVQAASDHGANAGIEPSGDTYVVVLRSADPNAIEYACGNPLSNQRQYFELWPAGDPETVGLGTVMSETVVSTEVDITLNKPAPAGTAWAVRVGNCSGQLVTSGTVATGSQTATGFIFEQLVPGQWWLSVGPAGQQGTCVKVD